MIHDSVPEPLTLRPESIARYSRLGRVDFSLCYFLLQTLAWSAVPALFLVRVFGREHVPAEGGALLM